MVGRQQVTRPPPAAAACLTCAAGPSLLQQELDAVESAFDSMDADREEKGAKLAAASNMAKSLQRKLSEVRGRRAGENVHGSGLARRAAGTVVSAEGPLLTAQCGSTGCLPPLPPAAVPSAAAPAFISAASIQSFRPPAPGPPARCTETWPASVRRGRRRRGRRP